MEETTIDDMFIALNPAAKQIAAAVKCDVLHPIFSEGYGNQISGKPTIAVTKDDAVKNARFLSDTLALTYCHSFGATDFKLVKRGEFTGIVGYHKDGTPLVCIIRGFFEVAIGENGTQKNGYVSIATVYSLRPKSSD